MKRYAAEFLGTFVLVLVGLGSAVLAGDRIGPLGIGFAFGLSLLAMVYAIGPVSGCHINPAVTLGMLLTRKMNTREAPGYMLAQVSGAIVATAILLLIARGAAAGFDATATGLGANGYGDHSPGLYNLGSVFLTEVLLTALLVFVVLGATDVKAPVGFAGLAIGLALTMVHLIGIPVSNASVNPARSIGPAVFVGGWALSQLWLFIVAPLLGAVAAAGAYLAVHGPTPALKARRAESAPEREQAERGAGPRVPAT